MLISLLTSLFVAQSPPLGPQLLAFGGDLGLRRVEALILSGKSKEALRKIERNSRAVDGRRNSLKARNPRVIRLEMLARCRLGDSTGVHKLAIQLGRYEGWAAYAQPYLKWRASKKRVFGILTRLDLRRVSTSMLALFALAMGTFFLGGGRELLRPHRESLVMLSLCLALIFASQGLPGAYSEGIGLIAAAGWALMHGATATMARVGAGARARLMLSVVLIAGLVGAIGATFARLSDL